MAIGVVALLIGVLPWLGLGPFAFVIPGHDIILSRLEIFHSEWVYDAAAFPLHLLALIPPLDGIIYFDNSPGIVRPFVIFFAYSFVGVCCIWIALRPDYRRR